MCERCSSENAREEVAEKTKFEVIWHFSGWCKTFVMAFDAKGAREAGSEEGYDLNSDEREITEDYIDDVNEASEELEEQENGKTTNKV